MWAEAAPGGRITPVLPATQDAVRRLCEWGAADWCKEGFGLTPPWTEATLALFAPLLDLVQIKVIDTTLPHAPVEMVAVLAELDQAHALPAEIETLELVAGGQGDTKAEALLSAFGELAERLSLWTSGENDPRVFRTGACPELELGPVLGFSVRQELELAQTYRGLSTVSSSGGIDWNRLCDRRVQVREVGSGRASAVPAFGVLMGEGRGLGLGGLGLVSTSGTAVYDSHEEALRRAVEEVVERDVVSQAWYNRLGITVLESMFWQEFIHRNPCDYLQNRPRRTDFLILDTDLATHVVLAVSREPDGLGACVGSAAGRSVGEAMASALGELLQSERSRSLAVRSAQSLDFPQWPADVRYGATVDLDKDLGISAFPEADLRELAKTHATDDLIDSCLEKGLGLYAFNATRADIGIPCVKVLSGDLCSWQPRFGKARLFEGVVRRGHADEPLPESILSARPFPF
ncbi:YcaO-like family protein [Roseibium sp.]|uniref:YcaO-like family protein n=1 Tax=Roseibium sp. TaxID=1936156 RepID=UPI003A979A9E